MLPILLPICTFRDTNWCHVWLWNGLITFADAAREWLSYVEFDRKRRASTLRDYRHVVDNALVPMFGEVRLEQLTSEMIDAYRVHLVAEDRLSARTINKYLVLMNGILRHAQRRWGLTVNPALGVERQPVRRSGEFRVLSAGATSTSSCMSSTYAARSR
jgi:site-specific recombinase XerD